MARYFCLVKTLLVGLVFLLFSKNVAAQQDTVWVYYTVQKGDNLYRLSLRYQVTVQQIMDWNGLTNANAINVGQRLRLGFKKVDGNTPNPPQTTQPNQPVEQPKETGWVIEPDTPKPEIPAQVPTKSFKVNHPFNKDSSQRHEPALIYSGTRIAPKEEEFDTTGTLDITGYISAYYAYYTDSVGPDSYQKFPTLSPHSNEVGLNLVQLSAKYKSEKIRGIITLHWGDMPDAAWSPRFNLFQQANLGIRIVPKLWFDIGYFRTHVGLESVQPRENINSTVSITTYLEPYYLSGAKLTWQPFKFLTVQANMFNQFNGYIETNQSKMWGMSAMIDPSPNVSVTLNTMKTDDVPDYNNLHKPRWYHDLYVVWKTSKSILGFEANYGLQKNSQIADSTATAFMFSGQLAFKYCFTKRFSIYTRGEYVKDTDGMMSGTFANGQGKNVGIDIYGITGGIEVKPIPNSYVRFEYRRLNDNRSEGDIFYYQGNYRTYRNEFVFSTGFWF